MKNKKRDRSTARKLPSPHQPPLHAAPPSENTSRSTTTTPTPGGSGASATPQKKHTGVTRYSIDFALLICERIATTVQPVSRICQAPDMPGVATLFRWLREHPDFREMYCEAKRMQAELLLEEALEIVDDDSKDLIITATGQTLINRAALQRSKMRVEYRKWIASKLLPRRYGTKPLPEPKALAPARPPSSPPPARRWEPTEDPDLDGITALELRLQAIEARRQAAKAHPENDQDPQRPVRSSQSSVP